MLPKSVITWETKLRRCKYFELPGVGKKFSQLYVSEASARQLISESIVDNLDRVYFFMRRTY